MAVLSAYKGDGYIGYPPPKWRDLGSGSGGGHGGGSGGGGSSGGSGGGGYGGLGGGGKVWSSVEQVIFIQVDDGPKYPVYLKPGNNDITFWVPSIYPKDVYIPDAPVVIEATGYILIPAGFEWNMTIGDGVPEDLGNRKMSDRLEIRDTYNIELVVKPLPIEESLSDDLLFEDVSSTDIILPPVVEDLKYTDDLEFGDVSSTDIILPPVVEDLKYTDDLEFEDVSSTDIILPPFSGEIDEIEELEIQDIEKVDIVLPPSIREIEYTEEIKLLDEHIEDKEYPDNQNKEDVSLNGNGENKEEMDIEDVMDIDI